MDLVAGAYQPWTMDFSYQLPTIIHVLKTSTTDDAIDLIALGGDHSVDVLQVTDAGIRSLASFYIGLRITAVAWSNNSVSPSSSENWSIECAQSFLFVTLFILVQACSCRRRPKTLSSEQKN